MDQTDSGNNRSSEKSGGHFQPDWRLNPSEALAVHVRLALERNGIEWRSLDTDEKWERMCVGIINGLKNDAISPCAIVELPRAWEVPSNVDRTDEPKSEDGA